MKKYILIVLYCFSLNAMENTIIQQESRDWNTKTYAKGNFIQKQAALQFLQEAGLDFTNSRILDVGCGPGDITVKIAEGARTFLGIDPSKNMITYAQDTYDHISHVTFQHCCIKNFIPKKPYDYVVSFFYLHFIEDKKEIFKKINLCLKNKGEFFGTIMSTAETLPLSLCVGIKFINNLAKTDIRFENLIAEKEIGISYISDKEIKKIIQETGFTIISYEKKYKEFIVKSRKEIEKILKPTFMSRPFLQVFTNTEKKRLFRQFIGLYLPKLQKNNDGHYIFTELKTTVMHLYKTESL
jgi:ubiquinone/menaquinone biosynthesis C-methylase UbiE